ncbi:hypothetical protein CLOSTMETH_01409 [[Clostridium] methylpentosum DSM 5476]|uniref:Uncharacterized protein n=1 Tax=[Clostridium] methylpentosum DSM 5476 TaxID=537013 RepID=C0EC40_9FIRM|nr:hypothetical protein CLOSTMETH_01409 [[Clostridium] methylpentosum DSM 5476]
MYKRGIAVQLGVSTAVRKLPIIINPRKSRFVTGFFEKKCIFF